MENMIKKNIENIRDEVKEFHPLIRALLSKIPNVENVEYTQGSREFGADFIFFKRDEDIEDDDCVGVIAKVGKITQNNQEVIRQINECLKVPRVIKAKEKVNITEIWIMTTGGISSNAKDLFFEEYKSTKLKFFSGEKIAKLAEKYIPNYWRNVSFEIGQYLAKASERLQVIENSSTIGLGSLEGYEIEQELEKTERNSYRRDRAILKKPRRLVNIYEIISKKTAAVIEGRMGSGKSSLLRKAAQHFCHPDVFSKDKIVPIFISLKELNERCDGSLEVLIGQVKTANFPDEEENSYLVLLDGMDEVKISQKERVDVLKKLVSEADSNKSIKLVMAMRTSEEKITSMEYPSTVDRYEIQPLSTKKIVSLIEKTCASLNIKNRIVQDLPKSNLFKILPKTPIAAILLTKLLMENHTELPANLPELYSKYTELSLGRWDIDKGLRSQKEYEVIHRVVIDIARFMIDNDLPSISISEARKFFIDYLSHRNSTLNGEELFNNLVSRSDLVSCDQQSGTFSFRHRTFCEFFYARGINGRDYEINENSFDFYWATINYFWVGLLKDCPEVIDSFSHVVSSDERNRLLKLVNFGNMLLAAHQTPYSHIEVSLKKIFVDAGKYFCEIKDGTLSSFLGKYSEMQLLCILRYIMSEGYGYDFLKKGIETALLEIETDSDLDVSVKCVALFLLNTSYMTVGGNNIFDGLISSFASQCPLSVQLAIQHEISSNDIQGPNINRIHRNIRKIINQRDKKSQRSIKNQLDDLYGKPINKVERSIK